MTIPIIDFTNEHRYTHSIVQQQPTSIHLFYFLILSLFQNVVIEKHTSSSVGNLYRFQRAPQVSVTEYC